MSKYAPSTPSGHGETAGDALVSTPAKTFRSRCSVLLVAILHAAFLPALADAGRCADYELISELAIIILFIACLLANIRCVISDGTLRIKIFSVIPYGPRVKIADIATVKRSYNPLSAPAASLKRLRIDFTDGRCFWLVSPAREAEFINVLKAANPAITADVTDKKGLWRILNWDL